jgi:hypothetical protein
MSYILWPDAKEYLDEDSVELSGGEIDFTRMTEFIERVEQQLDNRLRRYMTVPVDETASPDAFAQVQNISAMQSAAMYLRWAYSAEGSPDHTWWAEELDRMAEVQITALTTGRSAPTDIEDASSPLQYVPSDGKAESSTEPDAIFTRDQVPGGTEPW